MSPLIATLSNESDPSWTRMCPEAGFEMSESEAPASVEVVDKKDKFPDPSVPNTWFALPSEEGRTKDTFESVSGLSKQQNYFRCLNLPLTLMNHLRLNHYQLKSRKVLQKNLLTYPYNTYHQ